MSFANLVSRTKHDRPKGTQKSPRVADAPSTRPVKDALRPTITLAEEKDLPGAAVDIVSTSLVKDRPQPIVVPRRVETTPTIVGAVPHHTKSMNVNDGSKGPSLAVVSTVGHCTPLVVVSTPVVPHDALNSSFMVKYGGSVLGYERILQTVQKAIQRKQTLPFSKPVALLLRGPSGCPTCMYVCT